MPLPVLSPPPPPPPPPSPSSPQPSSMLAVPILPPLSGQQPSPKKHLLRHRAPPRCLTTPPSLASPPPGLSNLPSLPPSPAATHIHFPQDVHGALRPTGSPGHPNPTSSSSSTPAKRSPSALRPVPTPHSTVLTCVDKPASDRSRNDGRLSATARSAYVDPALETAFAGLGHPPIPPAVLDAHGSRDAFRSCRHPFPADLVPYPRDYDRAVTDFDVWDTLCLRHACKSLTFHTFPEGVPPRRILDVGCGPGTWVLECARQWKESTFVGLDVAPIQPDLSRLSRNLSKRITWLHANFLEPLAFADNEFDLVHIKRIARGVPEDKWDVLFEEVARVMKPGAALEVIEEDLTFPGRTLEPEAEESERTSVRSEVTSTTTSTMTSTVVRLPCLGDNSSSSSGSSSKPSTAANLSQPCTPAVQRSRSLSLTVKSIPAAGAPGWLIAHVDCPKKRPSTAQSGPPAMPTLRAECRGSFSRPGSSSGGSSSRGSTKKLIRPTDRRPSTATGLKPPPSPPRSSTPAAMVVENPREHSVLERIYNEMHVERFVNLTPLNILGNALGMWFKDVRTDAPIMLRFPPNELGERTLLSEADLSKGVSPYASFDDAHMGQGLPNGTMEVDLRTLNVHLALRVREVLGCAEAMWEWVVGYQRRMATNPRLGAGVGAGADSIMVMRTIQRMSRAEFDELLVRFELDMQDHAAHGRVLADRFGWCTAEDGPPLARRIFLDRCARYSKTGRGPGTPHPATRLSRSIRVFVGWKP